MFRIYFVHSFHMNVTGLSSCKTVLISSGGRDLFMSVALRSKCVAGVAGVVDPEVLTIWASRARNTTTVAAVAAAVGLASRAENLSALTGATFW